MAASHIMVLPRPTGPTRSIRWWATFRLHPSCPRGPLSDDAPKKSNRGGNLIALAIAQALRLGSGLAVNVLLMRVLGVEGYGVYGYILTLVGLASFGATLGMFNLINRELAREPERTGELVATGIAAVSGLSIVTGALVVGWAGWMDGRPEVVGAAALAAVALGLQSLASIPEAACHAHQRMALSVAGQIAGRIALVVGTAALLWLELGVAAVFAAQLLDALITFVVIWRMYRRHLAEYSLRPNLSAIRSLTSRSIPFGLNLLFGSIYLSVDVLLLAELKDDTEVGVYRGAVMLIALFPVIANTLNRGLFPRMARFVDDPIAAGGELKFATRVLLAVSIPAAVGGMLVAEPLLVFLGGEAFSVSALSFVVMAPLLPLRFLNNSFGMTLSTLDRQSDRTRGVALAAVVNLATNLLVIPTYGAVGAAATTLGTEVLLMAWFGWHVRPLVRGVGLPGNLLRTLLPAGAMAAGIWWLPPTHVTLQIALGVGIYAVVGGLTGAWRPADLKRLRKV